MNVATVRDGLKAALADISGLRTHDTIPDQINPPAAVVRPSAGQYDHTMSRGHDEMFFDIVVLASRVSERSGQDTLDGYMAGSGNSSVKTVIEADRTLDSSVSDVRVVGWSDYGTLTVAGIDYLAVTFSVHVVGTGT